MRTKYQYTLEEIEDDIVSALNLWALNGERLLSVVEQRAKRAGMSPERFELLLKQRIRDTNWMKNKYVRERVESVEIQETMEKLRKIYSPKALKKYNMI